MTFLYFYVGFVFGSLLVLGSPTSFCHDGDVDLIFTFIWLDDLLGGGESIFGYFAKRDPNATGNLRVAIVDSNQCKTVLELTIYSSSEQFKKIKKDLRSDYYQYNSSSCDIFSHVMKIIDKNVTKKTFLIWHNYFYLTQDVIRRSQNLNDLFPFLYQIQIVNRPKPETHIAKHYFDGADFKLDYHKPQPNIFNRFLDSDPELIGAKFCRVCPQGWIAFTSQQKPHVSSCYYLNVKNKPISWIQARDECKYNDSILGSFETYVEFEYVFNAIRLHEVQTLEDKLVYIGLISKRDGAVNTYRWTSGGPFTLPLKYQEIFIGNYDLEMCIILKCVIAKTGLGKNSSSTPCNKQNIELITGSCLEGRTNLFICELERARKFNGGKDRMKVPSLKITKTRREFVTIGNNIVSVSNMEHNSPEFKFDCGNNLQHVPYSSVCDKVFDCDNGKDEEYCYEKPRRIKYDDLLFTCTLGESNKFKIFRSMVCDGIFDCADGSDESNCKQKVSYTCSDGTYVPIGWLRGNKGAHCFLCNDCNNTNSKIDFINTGTDQCAFPPELTYGVTICDKTSQKKGSKVSHCKNKLSNKRWTPSCLYIRRSTSVLMGCPDMSHLQDCQLHNCPDGFIKCPNDYCIPVYYINDGIMDCRYGEDETQNINLNGRGYFKCNSGTIFLHPNNICDGEKQCLDGEDELNCLRSCPEGFKCEGGVEYSNHVEYVYMHNDLKLLYVNITNAEVRSLGFSFFSMYKLVLSNCRGLINDFPKLGSRVTHYSLYYLDLSYNQFSEIHENNIFIYFPNLRFLNFSHNNDLHTLKIGENGPKRLNTLDLSYTKISVFLLHANDEKYPMKFLYLYKSKIIHLGWLKNIKYIENLDLKDTLLTNDVLSPDDLSNISIKVSLQTNMFKLCCPSYRGPGVPAHVCISPSDAVSSCEDLLSDTFKRVLLWMVATIAFVGNITVIYYRVFHDRGVFKKAYGVFVTNLGVADLLMGAYLILIAAVDMHYRDVYVINEAYWRHSVLCKAAGFLSTLSSETSTFFIFLITLDRFLVMQYPFGNHGFKKWSITLSVVSTWCAGIIMALLPLTFDFWELYSSNGLCLGMPLTVSRLDGWPYSFAIFIVLNLCMFLLIALGQVAIFRSMTSSRDTLANSHYFDRRVQDVAVAKKLSLVVLSNFLCWFPICVIGLRSKFGVEPNPEILAWLLVFVLPLNAAVNPMIYTIPVVYNKWLAFKQAGYHSSRRSYTTRT